MTTTSELKRLAEAAIDIDRPPTVHDLKTWASYFHAVLDGRKNFEIRRDDRDFKAGDTLLLRETDYASGEYTGRSVERKISYILRMEPDLGLADGFAILSLEPLSNSPLIARLEKAEAALDMADRAHNRLAYYASQAHNGHVELNGREMSRQVWGAFSDFYDLKIPYVESLREKSKSIYDAENPNSPAPWDRAALENKP